MKLTITQIDQDGTVFVKAEGQITSLYFQQHDASPFDMLIGSDWPTKKLVMDMEKVGYVDSTAIGWLVGCHKKFVQQGGGLALHSIHPGVQQIFDMMKIGLLFPLADNAQAAKAAVLNGRKR